MERLLSFDFRRRRAALGHKRVLVEGRLGVCQLINWARLLKRVFDIERGTLKIIAAIEEPPVIARILAHLGLPTRASPRAPARRFDLFQVARSSREVRFCNNTEDWVRPLLAPAFRPRRIQPMHRPSSPRSRTQSPSQGAD